MKYRLFVASTIILVFLIVFPTCTQVKKETWKPNTDWGHWILGHHSDFEFLEKNNMTITFGSGAPNFERVNRAKFDSLMQEAKKFNQTYHNRGYTVLRYLSTSLNGDSESNNDTPQKDQINILDFYNEAWDNFADYIGPKPAESPTSWMMVHPDDSFPYYRYAPYGREPDSGFEAWVVPVNPHYVRFMEGKMRAQAETGIDGSYIDWTHIASNTSYDTYSHQGFIKYLTEHLPTEVGYKKYGINDYSSVQLPTRRGEKFWMEWIKYRGYMVAEFHKHMKNTARKYNPHFMISGNVFGGFGFGPIAYDGAGNMEMLGRDGYDDFIYSEMQEYLDATPRNKDGVKITNSPALKFLAAVSHGKPAIIYATEITPPIFPNPTEKCLSAMAQINIAEAVANHCIFREKRKTPPGATEMYQFLASNRPHLIGSHLKSNIAILASLNQYLADEQSFAFTTSRIMSDKGFAHVFIVEDDVEHADLLQYDLIVLPYLPLLSIEKQNQLIEYVKKGGKLIVLDATGSKNEFNLNNEKIPLLEESGLKTYPAQKTSVAIGNGVITHIPLSIPNHHFLTITEQKADATTFGASMANVFADIPEAYTRNKIHGQLRTVLNDLVSEAENILDNKMTRLLSDAPFVEISTMQKEGIHILVHLVNYDVSIDGDVNSTGNLDVQILFPEGYKIKQISYSGNLGKMELLNFIVTEKGTAKVQFP